MKVNSIQTSMPLVQSGHKKQSFKGFDNVVIKTMDAIDRGGLFASFTTQDMLGTNLPRPLTALSRNKKEAKGKKNVTFALKEAIREFTTGPSMFIIPGTMLYGAKKLIGKSVDVPENYISTFTDVYSNAIDNVGTALSKEQYYTSAFTNMLKTSTGRAAEDVAEEASTFAKDLIRIEKAPSKGFFKRLAGTFVDGSKEDLITNLSDKFSSIVKKNTVESGVDFTVAKMQDGAGKIIASPFEKMVTHIGNYTDDIVEKTGKKVSNLVETPAVDTIKSMVKNTTSSRIIQRFGMNFAMFAAVMVFLPLIPKLYNISKDNPALRGLENAVPQDNTQTKGAA